MLPRLRELPFQVRLGLSLTVLVILGGLAASGAHMVGHHDKNDRELESFTYDDVRIHYAGKFAKSPLLTALEDGHPKEIEEAEEFPDEDRQFLIEWLRSDRVAADYDNIDLGDFSPKELVGLSCAGCHGREQPVAGPEGVSWDLTRDGDVLAAAASERIDPIAAPVLIASTHVHATMLGALLLVVVALALATSFSPRVIGFLVLLAGLGLFVDLACWWLARDNPQLVPLIIGGGALFAASAVLLLLLVLLDMWLPRKRQPAPNPD